MLCYAVLCYAVLCYAVLRYAVLCYAVLCCAMLCYAVLRCAMLCYAMRQVGAGSPLMGESVRRIATALGAGAGSGEGSLDDVLAAALGPSRDPNNTAHRCIVLCRVDASCARDVCRLQAGASC